VEQGRGSALAALLNYLLTVVISRPDQLIRAGMAS
jgi:hypothetical protein